MLRLEALTRRFGETVAVSDLSLEVQPGEILSLLGPSGCGKTTTLRMIAGFESPTSGRVWLEGRDLTGLSPQKRGMGMVFQNYALFPHLNVWDNVAFGLQSRGERRDRIPARVERALQLVELAGFGQRRVQDLSGGQQQRVAVARALAPEPPVLLLDEPLSNLDAALRERTRTELRVLLKRLGITAIFVTHDQEEAFALSDRIALLHQGQLQQMGTPEELYADPSNRFVASFLGQANFLPAVLDGSGSARLDGDTLWPVRPVADLRGGVQVMARPESLRLLRADGERGETDLEGSVLDRRFAGAASFYRVRTGDVEIVVQGGPSDAAAGDAVWVRPRQDARALVFATDSA